MAARNSTAREADDRTLVITRVFDAPRSLVFEAWTKPEHLVHWWGRRDVTLPVCEVDFRPGGAYRFCMRAPAGRDFWVSGVYREIVEPERLVFTCGLENEEKSHEALWTVTFAEREGKTTLTVHQVLFDPAQAKEGLAECLERLAEYLAKA
jgi:uncharacterized protein YndB with AHSA1/START domain